MYYKYNRVIGSKKEFIQCLTIRNISDDYSTYLKEATLIVFRLLTKFTSEQVPGLFALHHC